MQRRLVARTAGVALALGLALAGCSHDNTPSGYDDGYLPQKNFLEGCTNYLYNVDGTGSDATLTISGTQASSENPAGGSDSQCRCQYQVFVNQVPYNDAAKGEQQYAGYQGPTFVGLNKDLKGDNPQDALNKLPDSVKNALNGCVNSGPSAGGSTGSTTSTTAASGAGSTTTAG